MLCGRSTIVTVVTKATCYVGDLPVLSIPGTRKIFYPTVLCACFFLTNTGMLFFWGEATRGAPWAYALYK